MKGTLVVKCRCGMTAPVPTEITSELMTLRKTVGKLECQVHAEQRKNERGFMGNGQPIAVHLRQQPQDRCLGLSIHVNADATLRDFRISSQGRIADITAHIEHTARRVYEEVRRALAEHFAKGL